jgi:glyoxylase I family protein
MPEFSRISHISFSVRDCEKTSGWWREVFDLPEVARIEEDTWRAILLGLPGGMAIEFQQHDANEGETFDPERTGFDHMGLKVDSRDELLAWQSHFERFGVEHTPVVDRVYDGQTAAVLTFKDPDRIQYEMFWMQNHPE